MGVRMEKEKLQKIKNDIENMKQKMEEYKKIVPRLQELEQNPSVKEYLNLLGIVQSYVYNWLMDTNNCILLERVYNDFSFWMETKTTHEKTLYMYLGTFKNLKSMGAEHYLVNRKDVSAEYNEYQNLENQMILRLPILLCGAFEASHAILFPQYFSNRYLFSIQSEFYRLVRDKGTEEASKQIMKKYAFENKI